MFCSSPSILAKEFKKKKKTHTYINVRPGRKPHLIKDSGLIVARGRSPSLESSVSSTVSMELSNSVEPIASGRQLPERKATEKREEVRVYTGEGSQALSDNSMAAQIAVSDLPVFEPLSQEKTESRDSDGLVDDGEYDRLASHLATGAASDGDERLSGSPSGEQRRKLVVHHYENFPFNPVGEAKENEKEMLVGESSDDGLKHQTSVTSANHIKRPATPIYNGGRESARSGASEGSVSPPLPERPRAMSSDIERRPSLDIQEKRTLSPLSQDKRGKEEEKEKEEGEKDAVFQQSFEASQMKVVQRVATQDGIEYALINPAWKKGKGKRRHLSSDEKTRLHLPSDASDEMGRPYLLSDASDDRSPTWRRESYGTPPPLPYRPDDLGASMERNPENAQNSGNERISYVDLDSDVFQKKRAELGIESRFSESVQYVTVEKESRNSRLRTRGNGYEDVDLGEQQSNGKPIRKLFEGVCVCIRACVCTRTIILYIVNIHTSVMWTVCYWGGCLITSEIQFYLHNPHRYIHMATHGGR